MLNPIPLPRDHTRRPGARLASMNRRKARALKSVQYSPAPYTDGVKAIRDRFLQPGDVV